MTKVKKRSRRKKIGIEEISPRDTIKEVLVMTSIKKMNYIEGKAVHQVQSNRKNRQKKIFEGIS